MIVFCIDDKGLPPGANVHEGTEYEVLDQYKNMLDQVVYIIKGVNNEGRTRLGMQWKGYRSERFVQVETEKIFEEESEVIYN
jgi:hypothetical protein